MATKNVILKDKTGKDELLPKTSAGIVTTGAIKGKETVESALSDLDSRASANASSIASAEGRISALESSSGAQSGDLATLKGYFTDGAAKKAVADADGNEISSTYAKEGELGIFAKAPKITSANIDTYISDSSIDSGKIVDGTIVDADISTVANIAQSKVSGLVAALADSASLSKPNEFASAQSFPNGASFGAVGISIGGVTLTQPELSSAKANAAEVPALSASLDEERSQRIASDDALSTRIGNLEGKTTRLFYGDGGEGDPDAAGIQAFVDGLPADPPYEPPYSGVAVVVRWAGDGTLHVWHYYENIPGWQDDGIDTVTDFTDSSAGIITGSPEDGYVSADGGRGRVSGWGTAVRGSGLTEGAILIGAGGVGAQASIYSPEEEFTGSAAALPTSAAVLGKLSEYLPLSGGSMGGSLSMGAYPLIAGGHFEVTPEGDALFAGASTFTGDVQMNGDVTFAGEGDFTTYKSSYFRGTVYLGNVKSLGGTGTVHFVDAIESPSGFKSGDNSMSETGITATAISTYSGALPISAAGLTYVVGGQVETGGNNMPAGILTTIPYVAEEIADAVEKASADYVKRIQPSAIGDYAYMVTQRAQTSDDGLVSISQRADPSSIARRWDSGDIDVALEPTEPQHAASKSYVDAQTEAAEASAADALSAHEKDHSNPHGVTKAQVGLGSVEDAPMDDSPTDGSGNYVSSGGVKAALSTRLGYTVASVGGDADPKYAYAGGSTDSAAVSISQEGTITAEVSDGGITLAKLADDAKEYIDERPRFINVSGGFVKQSLVPAYYSISDPTVIAYDTAISDFGWGKYEFTGEQYCFVFKGNQLMLAKAASDGSNVTIGDFQELRAGDEVCSGDLLYKAKYSHLLSGYGRNMWDVFKPIACRFPFEPIFANNATYLNKVSECDILLKGSGTSRGGISIGGCKNINITLDTSEWNAINDNNYMTFSFNAYGINQSAFLGLNKVTYDGTKTVGNPSLSGYGSFASSDGSSFFPLLNTWSVSTSINDSERSEYPGTYTYVWLNFGNYQATNKNWHLYKDGVIVKSLKLNWKFNIDNNGTVSFDVVPYFVEPTATASANSIMAMSLDGMAAEQPKPIEINVPDGAIGIFSVDADGHTINAMTGEAID